MFLSEVIPLSTVYSNAFADEFTPSPWDITQERAPGDTVLFEGYTYLALRRLRAGAANQVNPREEHEAYLTGVTRVNWQERNGADRQWERVAAINQLRIIDSRPSQRTSGPSDYRAQVSANRDFNTLAYLELGNVNSIDAQVLRGADAVTLSWTTPNNGGKAFTGASIRYRPEGEDWTTVSVDVSGGATRHEIFGLNVEDIYQFQIRFTNEDGGT